jgi:3-hydroxymyristoyl/3-hydroxydecanoyl-(acyl carrier protein) dehydratase
MNHQNSHLQAIRIAQLQISNHQSSGLNQSSQADQEHSSTTNSSLLSRSPIPQSEPVIWDEADLLEFAVGDIANVFGEAYAVIDSYPRRVRLPMPPYLLVSRVTQLNAQRGQFKPCSITTEYDIPLNAPSSVDGQISWAVVVESGQCDLLLISYLGIDFENQGNLVYRLLDCTLTFLDDLPKAGETLRYDIQINSFVRSGSNLLFFFSYECFVGDRLVLKMEKGCAGFFSDEQLAQGKGVVFSEKELRERTQIQKQVFEPLLLCQKMSFDHGDLLSLSDGCIADCFGYHYQQGSFNSSLRLPHADFLMLDRITSVNPTDGTWGLGMIIAEKSLKPDDWYFPCHFKDDQVMAGSLLTEGCSQLLQFYMLYLGLQTCTTDARFQPIPDLPQVVRCRGQVTPKAAVLTYRMEISAIGFTPNPYVKCNVEIMLDDKVIVHFQDLGWQLSEKDPKIALDPNQTLTLAPQPVGVVKKSALLNEWQIAEFCTGSLSKCFGSEYEIYDRGNVKSSRLPSSHLRLVHRVLTIEGERHRFTERSAIIAEYDVPQNPWYCRQNSSPTIPYCILMEMALQPSGCLSAYLGTGLMFPTQSLYCRNLDGKGQLLSAIDLRGKTITNRTELLSFAKIQGMVIQNFNFQMQCDGEVFYKGTTTFGYFSPEALANQVGLDRGKNVSPWCETADQSYPEINLNLSEPKIRHQLDRSNSKRPYYQLATHQLNLLHDVKIIPNGGKYQRGYLFAHKLVQPHDWYFKCHFQDDPVMPGSLGVEAMLQALQVYALQLDLGQHLSSPYFVNLSDHTTIWKYRGQIPQGQMDMFLEIHLIDILTTPDQVTLIGEASLWKAGLRIYEVQNLAIGLRSHL